MSVSAELLRKYSLILLKCYYFYDSTSGTGTEEKNKLNFFQSQMVWVLFQKQGRRSKEIKAPLWNIDWCPVSGISAFCSESCVILGHVNPVLSPPTPQFWSLPRVWLQTASSYLGPCEYK